MRKDDPDKAVDRMAGPARRGGGELSGAGRDRYREPGGTAIGEKIRQILLNPDHIAMSTPAEVMLYMAARVQLWQEKIAPALKDNKCVVLDRWLSSTCAYQGHAGGFGMDRVIAIAKDCLDRQWPDLTVVLDVDLDTASRRLNRERDRMEQKGDGYHKEVREGFLKLAEVQDNFVVIDATGDIQPVHKKVVEAVAHVGL
jgi:dTMP kinase